MPNHLGNDANSLHARATVTIGLTTLNAFVFMFIPDLFIMTDFHGLMTNYGVVFYIAALIKISVDFARWQKLVDISVIHYWRQDELWKLVLGLLVPWRD